jgi:hypothetical protein
MNVSTRDANSTPNEMLNACDLLTDVADGDGKIIKAKKILNLSKVGSVVSK